MIAHRTTYIASEAILLAREEQSFRLSELKERLNIASEQMPSNSTIRRVLQQLEDSGWLERKHPEGRTWYAGPQTRAGR